jgi:hypothetical protein
MLIELVSRSGPNHKIRFGVRVALPGSLDQIKHIKEAGRAFVPKHPQ